MIAALRLLPVLIRRAPRQAAGAAALCAVGVAVATLVAGTALAAYSGLGHRESRIEWREPTPAVGDEPVTALQRRSFEPYHDQLIDRVDLAGVDASGPSSPVPPGLRAFPEPGTAFVSPALARLIEGTADRFGRIVGTIDPDGLARPDELVAVVGTTAATLGPVDPDADAAAANQDRPMGVPSPVTPIHGYGTGSVDSTLQLYREMALVAVVLVSVPALMLVGSAARLTAARREQRLAAIRLAGATPGAVRTLAAAETALGAVVGAVVGVGASMVVAPLLHGVEVAGGDWYASDLGLPVLGALGLMAVAVLVSVVASVVSLRRVTSQPLGVARATEPQRARWPRVFGVVASFIGLVIAMLSGRGDGSAVILVAALAFVILSLGLVGPWIAALVGRVMAMTSRRPSTMIAGRRIMEDPRAAYRVVSAVVLAGLVAGFLAGILPTTEARLGDGVATDQLTVTLVGDVRRGSLVILLAALLLAAGSSVVAAAASVVDQRRTIGRLALAGVPVATLQSARRWQSAVPLVAATGGAVALGLGSAVMVMLGLGARPEQMVGPEVFQVLAVVVGAVVIGLASAAATRPLLVAAARSRYE